MHAWQRILAQHRAGHSRIAGTGPRPARRRGGEADPRCGRITGVSDPAIRVLIADDQEMIRTGFRLILDTRPGIEVVGEAADGVECVELARGLRMFSRTTSACSGAVSLIALALRASGARR
ncbi:hypothetical protein GCM10010420_13430 [Streptomyces glaucosporus]|uniref:Response regulatory domain-containing protein n=1 Tax=Streptomyces glaucosporus TaxID=284044 RepID=A0ABP5V2K3_9ACTN